MVQEIKQRLSQFSQHRVPVGQVSSSIKPIIMLITIAVVVAAAVVMTLWNSNSQYRPIFGEHEQYDQPQVLLALEQSGLDFYIDSQTGQVMVPRNDIARARLSIASAGVSPQKPSGLEILSTNSSLGTSQFIENARYKHGLEGELARSIMALDAVNNVRVHLAIPKQTLFVGRDKVAPSASVIVSLSPGRELTPQQVTAISNLVSGSVIGLDASGVNVIDQNGTLLSSNDPDSGAVGSASYLLYLDSLEQSYIERASKMLTPMFGFNNFRVQVAADINFDAVEATQEVYAPVGVVRSEFSTFDRKVTQDAQGVPGALSNNPPEEGEEGQNADNTQNERGENSREYVIDRTVKQIKYQQGMLERLSVSVLVNAEEGSFTEEQKLQLQQMLSNALGLQQERNDELTLTIFPFNNQQDLFIDDQPKWWQETVWLDYLQYLLMAIVALTILLVVVRPLMRELLKAGTVQPTNINSIQNNTANSVSTAVGTVANQQDNPTQVISEGDSQIATNESFPELSLPTHETGLEEQTAYLQMLSDKEPERVAHVVKQWIK